MNKRIIYFSFLILFISSKIAFSQERRDLGLQGGGTYYMGDYNEGRPLYQVSPSLGVLFKYNFNKFYSFRLSVCYGTLKGSYSSKDSYLPGLTPSFNKQLLESEVASEINFLSFNPLDTRKGKFTPYAIIGIGGAYMNGGIIPHIPLGVGVKYCPMYRVTVGFEWRLHKTFSDDIDNYQGVYNTTKPIFHNNDWFSFVGLFITYRLYNYNNTCPVYR